MEFNNGIEVEHTLWHLGIVQIYISIEKYIFFGILKHGYLLYIYCIDYCIEWCDSFENKSSKNYQIRNSKNNIYEKTIKRSISFVIKTFQKFILQKTYYCCISN